MIGDDTVFDGLDDGEGDSGIGGVDPYQIRDLQSGLGAAPGISPGGQYGVECPPALVAACKAPDVLNPFTCECVKGKAAEVKGTWQDTVTTGLRTAGELFKTQAQVQQAETMAKLNQMLAQGQITSQNYQLQVEELRRRAAVLAAQQSQTPGWFEKNKTLVIIGGLLLVAGFGIYMWKRKR